MSFCGLAALPEVWNKNSVLPLTMRPKGCDYSASPAEGDKASVSRSERSPWDQGPSSQFIINQNNQLTQIETFQFELAGPVRSGLLCLQVYFWSQQLVSSDWTVRVRCEGVDGLPTGRRRARVQAAHVSGSSSCLGARWETWPSPRFLPLHICPAAIFSRGGYFLSRAHGVWGGPVRSISDHRHTFCDVLMEKHTRWLMVWPHSRLQRWRAGFWMRKIQSQSNTNYIMRKNIRSWFISILAWNQLSVMMLRPPVIGWSDTNWNQQRSGREEPPKITETIVWNHLFDMNFTFLVWPIS